MRYSHSQGSDVAPSSKSVLTNQETPVVPGEVFPYPYAYSVCTKDANALETKENIKTFVRSNIDQYYIGINTWLLLTEDILGKKAEAELEDIILRRGLIPTIAICDVLATNLIARLDGSKDFKELPPWASALGTVLLHDGDDGLTLQVLRFMKRFTLLSSRSLREASVESFRNILFETNWRKVAKMQYNNYIQRDPIVSPPYPGYLGKLVRKYVHRLLKHFDQARVSEYPWSFSAGVCRSIITGQTLRGIKAKMSELNHFTHTFDVGQYGMPLCDMQLSDGWYYPTITIIPVPKNYKVYRMIAPEDVLRSIHMQQIRRELERAFSCSEYSGLYTKEDQTNNSELAKSSSVNAAYATIDLSSASDSYSKYLARYLLPEDVWDVVYPWLPKRVNLDGTVYPCSIFLTSGDPCTFDFESLLFLAISLAARELHYIWCRKWAKLPHVYGDDIIIDVETIEETISILTDLGFTVNEGKSFWVGQYRESCGVEYYLGYDVSTKYWPRKAIRIACGNTDTINTSISSLIALQHRLFNYSLTARFLKNTVLWIKPNMTFSSVGTDCDDLWSAVSDAKVVTAPFDGRRTTAEELRNKYGDVVLRERHMTLSGQYDPKYNLDPGVQLYDYYQFLANGPSYPDALSELLRVSDSRSNNSSPEMPVRWGLTTR